MLPVADRTPYRPRFIVYGADMGADSLDAPPNSERYLVPMLADGSPASPFWRCSIRKH